MSRNFQDKEDKKKLSENGLTSSYHECYCWKRDSSRLVLMDDPWKGPCWKKKESYFNTKDKRYKS